MTGLRLDKIATPLNEAVAVPPLRWIAKQDGCMMILTERLKLIPASVALARAEIADRVEFARLLGAAVPDNWPPETLADALSLFLGWLEAAPERVGWFGWYVLTEGAEPTLVASTGFKGPPQAGTAEIGYCVLPQFQCRGFATEMVAGLVAWATAQPGVDRIVAETEWANPASVRVLTKVGFVRTGTASEPDGARFELATGRPAAHTE